MKAAKPMVLVLTLLMTQLIVSSQTRPQQSLYVLNYGLLNPAYTGVENYGQVLGGFRRQWVGVDGAPSTNWLSASFPLKRDMTANATDMPLHDYDQPSVIDRGHGIGIQILQENIGPYTTLNADVAYAYHLPLSGAWALSMGFAGGIQQTHFDYSKTITPDHAIDPATIPLVQQKLTPDLNAGILLYSKDFFAGVSLLQIMPVSFVNTQDDQARFKPQLTGAMGYAFDMDDGGTRLWLSGIVKTDLINPVRYDLNAKLSFKNQFWAGVSYRVNDAVGVLAGFHITPKLFCTYMYDASTSTLMSTYSKGSHEFTIGYKLLKPTNHTAPKMGW